MLCAPVWTALGHLPHPNSELGWLNVKHGPLQLLCSGTPKLSYPFRPGGSGNISNIWDLPHHGSSSGEKLKRGKRKKKN